MINKIIKKYINKTKIKLSLNIHKSLLLIIYIKLYEFIIMSFSIIEDELFNILCNIYIVKF